jgi:hypothetical protein
MHPAAFFMKALKPIPPVPGFVATEKEFICLLFMNYYAIIASISNFLGRHMAYSKPQHHITFADLAIEKLAEKNHALSVLEEIKDHLSFKSILRLPIDQAAPDRCTFRSRRSKKAMVQRNIRNTLPIKTSYKVLVPVQRTGD